jgi:hypothetical protein
MLKVGRLALFLILAVTLLILHVLGYVRPELIVGSRLINRLVIPGLLAAVLLHPRLVQMSEDYWKDSAIRWGVLIFGTLCIIEALLNSALIVVGWDGLNELAKYIRINSEYTIQTEESRLGHLMVFSALATGLVPIIITGLRESFRDLGKG